MIGVPIVLMIIPRVAALAVGSGVGISISYTPYFVIAFILAPMFATRLYYAHARNKIGNIKARTPSVEEQRLERSARPHRAKRISITRVVVLLLIVFGIIAAISIPGYGYYTVRAQISEGLNLAGGA